MLYSILFILIILADQVAKYYISHNFLHLYSVKFIGSLVYLTYVKNTGAAFGVLKNQQLLFIIATSAILIFMLVYFIISSKKNILLRTSLILIMAGGAGNLIDRIRQGYVIDFLDLRFWPVFNIADMSVVVGSILLGYYILFKYKEEDEIVK